MSTQFNCQKHFYFKPFKQLYITIQFSVSTQLKCKYSLIVIKHFYFELFSLVKQLIQFSISTYFVYAQLHVKTVLC